MRAERAAFVEFFGCDELVLSPAEAEERINAFYRHRQEAALAARSARRRPPDIPGVDVPAFELPPELADAETVGVIYDEIDGLNFYNEYGMLRDLFADPALASDKRYADVLRGYLRAETIGPLPFRRLAAAHPQTVDAAFRRILRQPHFAWADFLARAGVEWRERLSAGRGQRQPALPRVARHRLAPQQPAALKAAQDTTQVTGIDAQIAGDFGSGRLVAPGELVQHAGFRQRERAFQQALLQYADLLRVEAVEAPYRGDAVFERSHAHLSLRAVAESSVN